jgi:hypothetical protein
MTSTAAKAPPGVFRAHHQQDYKKRKELNRAFAAASLCFYSLLRSIVVPAAPAVLYIFSAIH